MTGLPPETKKTVLHWKKEPSAFAKDVLGVDLWKKQIEIMEAVRDRSRVAVKACHASGKTRAAADTALWFLSTNPDSAVITTAPTWRQVAELLWRDMRHDYHRAVVPLGGRFLEAPHWQIDDKWYALGLSTDKPDRFQGHHASKMLVIVDEAAGVGEPVFEAIEGLMSTDDAKLLMLGNPTSHAGSFYSAFHTMRQLYHCITISAFDTPNFAGKGMVRPYLVTRQWVDDMRIKWGETNPLWYARILGEFSPVSLDTLIALQFIESAQTRWEEAKETDPCEFGVDVARQGDDETVIAIRKGNKLLPLTYLRKNDTMEVAGAVANAAAEYGPTSIKVDAVGIGAGVADRLRELSLPAIDIQSGARADDNKRYINKRAEMWDALAILLRSGDVTLPPDEALAGQLAAVKFIYDSTGRMQLESKADLKKRTGYSPDRADAVVYAFAKGETASLGTFEQPMKDGGSLWTDRETTRSRWRV
jgi:phage terminase large subunit